MSSRKKGEPGVETEMEGTPEAKQRNKLKRNSKACAWWHPLGIPAPRWQRQKDCRWEDSVRATKYEASKGSTV